MPSINCLGVPAVALCFSAQLLAHGVDVGCSDRMVVASQVSTREDVKAFVRCAHEFVLRVGTQEAYRAFHNDERWLSGPTYVFLLEAGKSAEDATIILNPQFPDREGGVWGSLPDLYGDDIVADAARVIRLNGEGWWYYAFPNPQTGAQEPKASFIASIEWNGYSAMIGAGVYERDLPGSCGPEYVSATGLASEPTRARLREFVRCAALEVEAGGYGARQALETSRWSAGSIYVFVVDMDGNQVLTGNRIRINGAAPHEWGGRSDPGDQFGGRDMASVGHTFGEAFLYYDSLNPMTGASGRKVALVKRVVAQGVPVLVGAGYYVD